MAVQVSASRKRTSWALRWKTPRSSARKVRTHPINPNQCQPVISARARLRTLLSSGSDRFDVHSRQPDFRPLTLVPPEHKRAGDQKTRIGAAQDAEQERKCEIIDHPAPEEQQRQ